MRYLLSVLISSPFDSRVALAAVPTMLPNDDRVGDVWDSIEASSFSCGVCALVVGVGTDGGVWEDVPAAGVNEDIVDRIFAKAVQYILNS